VIRTFRRPDAEALFNGLRVRRFQGFERVALRKLEMLNAATELRQLAVVPGNRLEALRGGRAGQHSLRISDQWRVCFIWHERDAYEAEIVDYH